jgi:two-component system, cell cycle response regulator DivK
VTKRLLIVEDNELNSDLLVQLFEDEYEIDIAIDGESAVALATTRRPDLILMDIGLPGMSGLDAVRHIRATADASGIPVVAVSSSVMPGDREEALSAGFDEFVPKPIDDTHLIGLVHLLLERR